jgi:hypothetical protein
MTTKGGAEGGLAQRNHFRFIGRFCYLHTLRETFMTTIILATITTTTVIVKTTTAN